MKPIDVAQPVSLNRLRLPFLAVTLLVLTLGAVEDWYGPTSIGDLYGSDAVSFLDVSRAIQHGDWRSALNPLWSQGWPALLAVLRPLFVTGPVGDWWSVRALNFGIFTFSFLCFIYLLVTCIRSFEDNARTFGRDAWVLIFAAGTSVFLAAQLCMDQASRPGPDQLVAALLFLATALFLRSLKKSALGRSLLLGAVLGIGFIVKAVFLPISCLLLATFAIAMLVKRRSPIGLVPVAAVFLLFVASYGAALSHAVGHFTLGEAGSLNYAWHVDRLHKWVHWEGGTLPPDEAWPKHWMVKFTHWDTHPPDFGKPIHPSVIVQENPRVYSFAAPIHSTYVPYFDPPYWYEGYHHIFNPRYQLIALAKSVVDLATVVLFQPEFYAVLAALLVALWRRSDRKQILEASLGLWPILVVGLLGIVIYLPVHLEGRYLSGFFALLAMVMLLSVSTVCASFTRGKQAAIVCLMIAGLAAQLAAHQQREIVSRIAHGWKYQDNTEWRRATAIIDSKLLPPGSRIALMTGGPSIPCDWAYIAQLQIVSETIDGDDVNTFWNSGPELQKRTLEAFHSSGAIAVVSAETPQAASAAGWRHVGDRYIYRF